MRKILRLMLSFLVMGRVDSFFMMMMKKEGAQQAQQMMGSPSSSDSIGTDVVSDTRTTVSDTADSACIEPGLLEEAQNKEKQAESDRDIALQAQKDAQDALRAAHEQMSTLQTIQSDLLEARAALEAAKKEISRIELIQLDLENARRSQRDAEEALQTAREEIDTLRTNLHEQTLLNDKDSPATDGASQNHQEIMNMLREINLGSEKHFGTLQQQLQEEMTRQREVLRLDLTQTGRVEELQREKSGLLGELKALHELYDRLAAKYDAKMEQEEKEKLAYFEQSLQEEVQKVISQRAVAFQTALQELRNVTEARIEHIQKESDERLANLRTDLETKAEHEANTMRTAYEQELAALQQQLVEAKTSLANALESSKLELDEVKAMHTKKLGDIRLEHANQLEQAARETEHRLEQVRDQMQDQAARDAAKVQKEHEAQVAHLEREIRKEQENTKRTLEKLEHMDSHLKLSEVEKEKQKQEFLQIIARLQDEIQEAHEETAYWMKAFATRAYFNSTQIGEGVVSFAQATKVSVVMTIQKEIDQANQIKNRSLERVNREVTQAAKALDPYTRPLIKVYNDVLSEHVNVVGAHLHLAYQENLAPVVANAQQFRRKKLDELHRSLESAFDEVVSLARKRCKQNKKQMDKLPGMARDRMRKVCKEPEVVIRDALRMVLVLLVIILRRPLWNLFCVMIRVAIRTVWYILSFGFLRKKCTSSSVPPAVPFDSIPDDGQNFAPDDGPDSADAADKPQ